MSYLDICLWGVFALLPLRVYITCLTRWKFRNVPADAIGMTIRSTYMSRRYNQSGWFSYANITCLAWVVMWACAAVVSSMMNLK